MTPPESQGDGTPNERIERERDLYRRLLELGREPSVEPFLKNALETLVEITRARRGYLQIVDPSVDDPDAATFSISHDYSDEQVLDVREMISTGIISQTLLSGETVETASAVDDQRFMGRESVQAAQIEAVLCAPIAGSPGRGVVYVQGGRNEGQFSALDRELVELFASSLDSVADRFLLEQRFRRQEDPAREVREILGPERVIGRSQALVRTLREISTAAPLDIHVLLTGETGTGKSLLARAIHDMSERRGGPFVELNCAAIPGDLVENELFGHEAGAFTAADRVADGKVAAAEQGTLFLDEIGELPLGSQAKLLQLLQSGMYYRLGGNREIHADVRIVAATNLDLERAVADGRFREDLRFRLEVLPVRVPSLSERLADIPELVDHFLRKVSARHRLPLLPVSPRALAAIESAEWPGNIRQLEHVLTAGYIRACGQAAAQVGASHVFPESSDPAADSVEPLTYQEATRDFQLRLVARTLNECNWNVSETARRLDLARSYVYKLVESGGLTRGGD